MDGSTTSTWMFVPRQGTLVPWHLTPFPPREHIGWADSFLQREEDASLKLQFEAPSDGMAAEPHGMCVLMVPAGAPRGPQLPTLPALARPPGTLKPSLAPVGSGALASAFVGLAGRPHPRYLSQWARGTKGPKSSPCA